MNRRRLGPQWRRDSEVAALRQARECNWRRQRQPLSDRDSDSDASESDSAESGWQAGPGGPQSGREYN